MTILHIEISRTSGERHSSAQNLRHSGYKEHQLEIFHGPLAKLSSSLREHLPKDSEFSKEDLL